jgi:hypothetical protein
LTQAERDKVPLVNADEDVVRELLGPLTSSATATYVLIASRAEVNAYIALDAQHQCRGLYIVGASKENRDLSSRLAVAERFLSQALGHSAVVKTAPADANSSRWFDGNTPLLARWSSGRLIELRIGDAAP